MAAKINIRGTELGGGVPKIIAPIVGADRAEILSQADEILKRPVQLVEWRADFFEQVDDVQSVLKMAYELRAVLNELPLLFTLRTEREGGQFKGGDQLYTLLNQEMARSGYVDLIDVEVFGDRRVVQQNIDLIHDSHVYVVGSNHNFDMTPTKEELVHRLCEIQAVGADVLKIAVMAKTKRDVAVLLAATAEMYEMYADKPLITMSMSPMGVISRISGEAFGSAATFGAVGQASAPGQIDAETLSGMLANLHSGMGD